MWRVRLCIALYGGFYIGLLLYRVTRKRAAQRCCNGCGGRCAYSPGVDRAVYRKGRSMKHGKRLTREQKKLLQKYDIDPEVWLVTKDTPERIELVHRYESKVTQIIRKGGYPE